MITFFNVFKQYPSGQVALDNICLEIASGEMVFLQGHSGAGKSTLLKLIALLERPNKGSISIFGKNLNTISRAKVPYYRRRIGFISQNPKLLRHYSIFENVAMPLVIAGYSKHDIVKRVRAALDRVGLLSKERCKPTSLSEGEQQRVGIARAVVHKPRVLLADEPTGNLDPQLSIEILKLFERFNQVGVTVLIASHDISLIENLPYRKIHLKQGQVIKTHNLSVTESEKEVING